VRAASRRRLTKIHQPMSRSPRAGPSPACRSRRARSPARRPRARRSEVRASIQTSAGFSAPAASV
jgi:hypothetical protein